MSTNKRIKFFLMALWILNLFPVYVWAGSVMELIREFDQKLQVTQDVEATFVQIEEKNVLQKKTASSGTIYVLKSGKIFWYTKRPKSMKVISNGDKIWMVDVEAQQVFEYKWEEVDDQTKVVLQILTHKIQLKEKFRISWLNEKKKQIILIPKQKMTLKKGILTYSSSKKYFEKFELNFALDRKVTLVLKDIIFNQGLLEKHQKTPIDENISPQFEFKK